MRRFVLLIPMVLLVLAACSDSRRFSPEAWREVDPYERTVFAKDLVGRRVLIGKSQREIYGMLGGMRMRGKDSATWNVGVDPDSGSPVVLQVDFRDGIATKATVHRE